MTAQETLTKKYGSPFDPSFRSKWIVTWDIKTDFPWFPVSSLLIHRDFQKVLISAFTALEAAGLNTEITSCQGCYALRNVRGNDSISIHSWGCAIDFDAPTNSLGSTKTTWTSEFLKVMSDNRIYWGGAWRGRKDPMHFALVNG